MKLRASRHSGWFAVAVACGALLVGGCAAEGPVEPTPSETAKDKTFPVACEDFTVDDHWFGIITGCQWPDTTVELHNVSKVVLIVFANPVEITPPVIDSASDSTAALLEADPNGEDPNGGKYLPPGRTATILNAGGPAGIALDTDEDATERWTAFVALSDTFSPLLKAAAADEVDQSALLRSIVTCASAAADGTDSTDGTDDSDDAGEPSGLDRAIAAAVRNDDACSEVRDYSSAIPDWSDLVLGAAQEATDAVPPTFMRNFTAPDEGKILP